ncbi:MAG: enoyl-CoA hydratase/isomerase family protein [Vulcanisaeta sp.]|jgi:2-oxoglutaroyl-CoA hydrolase|nr:enoyl-CoA hydratase/isomerase family protein [Vulcanisaeta sp.]MCG2869337.1 enoyl-CoA hydratase/isomerase family protein [Vulcanisaeta sp.]MCG2886886.1 enoyl-CoA hydratase/isomerase family protein [Vulcanisaeta sp.]MCG2892669.1 enoyl-CoA hydratase/isomerase family protein [Vulcanisaeta sp.]
MVIERVYAGGGWVVRIDGGIAEVIINRPPLNLITIEMRKELGRIIEELERDGDVRVVIFRGSGDKAFSAGGDVMEFLSTEPKELIDWGRTIEMIEDMEKPTIALLRGYVLGAGAEIALACDIRVGTPDVEIGLPEIRLGMVPASGGLTKLVKALGPLRARYYLLLGRRIKADEALQLGLIHELVSPERAQERVLEIAKDLLSLSPLALKALKQAIKLIQDAPTEAGYDIERKTFALLRYSQDFREGIMAFKEKRQPRFQGS